MSQQVPFPKTPDVLTEIACRTLCDVIFHWCGARTHDGGIRFGQRLASITIDLPLHFADLGTVPITCVILAAASQPNQTMLDVETGHCFEVVLTPEEDNLLRDFIDSANRVFFLLATPKQEISNLAGEMPTNRFFWHIVDAAQALRRKNTQVTQPRVLIPVQNELGITAFTLLWASIWVDIFFEPLRHPHIQQINKRTKLVELAFPRNAYGNNLDWRAAFGRAMETSLPALRALDNVQFGNLVGMGYGIQDIVTKLATTPDIDKVEVYCPEALQGSVALWLFGRIYHQFMYASANIGDDLNRKNNRRFLPLRPVDAGQTPRIIRKALSIVQQYYGVIGVAVDIVAPPQLTPEADRSFYGGGIGHFPWYEFRLDLTGLERHQSSPEDVEQSQHVLRELKGRILVPSDASFAQPSEFYLSVQEARDRMQRFPLLLFPREDIFLSHPRQLWIDPFGGAGMLTMRRFSYDG